MKHPGMINSIANEGEDLFEWSGDNFLQAKKLLKNILMIDSKAL